MLLGIAQGVGFGMLFKNTPAAVVVFFVLPTAWSILGSMVSWLRDAATWLDLNQTMQPLFEGSLTGAAVGPPRHRRSPSGSSRRSPSASGA